ncbi:MAG TPA: MFS transporter [Thermoanaerobaculia bacterium]|jgi:ACS family hexuronate transporter-like MFS transporter|nr:MFS transporter [Thermoanaerobaculia bacterium]
MSVEVSAPPAADAAEEAPPKRGHVRWIVCTLLLFATTINYIDRQVLGILAPTLQKEIGWTEIQYGYIVTSFQLAYAIGLLLVGRVLDVIGTKLGFAFAIVFWSIAAMAHALVRTPFGFGLARFGLGLGEAGNFPAAIKTVAEWFPKKERAFATGIFNGGSNLGAIVAPAIVPIIALTWSWQAAFLITGAIGFIWLFFWLWLYEPPEKHKRVTPGELAYIRSDAEEAVTPIPWMKIIGLRQTWAFAFGKFLTDPVWWFYLYWIPKFLNEKHGLTLSKLGPPLIVIYLVADVGSIGGGWLSSRLIKKGWTINAARKTTMLVCALAVVPIVFASQVTSLWAAVGLISLAAAAHQGWSANIFTTASDMFPRRAVGSVVGIGGMAGAIGGMLIASATGHILQFTGSYHAVFVLAGIAYLLALGVIHMLAPRLEPANV